ncbi:hypothetical protein Pyn_38949 [Prunus yedoensis var. nudiflora]|uniref:Uncharacterized protein n=1 Tax=Prunus yedoensis var. nudiflora TaxID=2094558 RepID=A0A315AVB2_PRUYE|nr:hypothetical protein Pyn_38949 [Prunus yedoensis var. nudiflora]
MSETPALRTSYDRGRGGGLLGRDDESGDHEAVVERGGIDEGVVIGVEMGIKKGWFER